MNEFLAGLIERATGRVAVLERRPRSMFEPVAPGTVDPISIEAGAPPPDDLAGDTDPDERDEAPGGSTREPLTGSEPLRVSRRDSSAAPAPLPLVPASPPSGPARRASDVRQPPPLLIARRDEAPPAPPEPASATPGEPSPPTGRPLAWPAQPFAPLPSSGATEDTHAGLPTRRGPVLAPGLPADAPRRLTAPDPGPTLPLPHAGLPRRGPVLAPGLPADAPRRLTAPGPTPPLPRTGLLVSGLPVLAAHVPARRGVRAAGSAAALPSPVHVTIGRVEVRATAPAAEPPPVRRAAPRPRLSLDDYLHGRRGGSR